MKSKQSKGRGFISISLALVMTWTVIPFAGLFAASPDLPCPNGPLAADLTGSAGGSSPKGTARYRERGSNRLNITVRGLGTSSSPLDVYIGDTKVGTITPSGGGSGQLRVDAPTATIDEGTAISIRNGTTVVLAGTFACVAGGSGASPTATPTTSPTVMPTVSPTVSPTAMPSVSPTAMPSVSPTAMPSVSPTATPRSSKP